MPPEETQVVVTVITEVTVVTEHARVTVKIYGDNEDNALSALKAATERIEAVHNAKGVLNAGK